MFTINLHQLLFHAYHGIHAEEKILGNTFEVNASLQFETDDPIKTLEQTIDYAAVYGIIKQRMSIATPLLETLVQNLADEIYVFDKRIRSITVSVEKKNPPITDMEGSVSVTLKKDF
jgi:dihydroneopterin aldolase